MDEQHHIIISFGSNFNRGENMRQARALIKALLNGCTFTRTLRTEAVDGGVGVFSNCMAAGNATDDLQTVIAKTKDIERQCGDTPEQRRHDSVAMDVDILLYDKKRLHEDDWNRPYIKKLLQELNIINKEQ